MGWTFSLDGVELAEEDLTAGQLERLFLLVNSEITHTEDLIGQGAFAHCPVCRVAIGTVALGTQGIPIDAASATIREVSASELAEAFLPSAIRGGEEAAP